MKVVELLLRKGANIQASNGVRRFLIEQSRIIESYAVSTMGQDGWTSLMLACEESYSDVVELLVDQGASLETKNHASESVGGCTPLSVASNVNIVECLLRNGANIEATNEVRKLWFLTLQYCRSCCT